MRLSPLLAAAATLAAAGAASAQTINLNVYGDMTFLGYNLDAGETPPALGGQPLLNPKSTLYSRTFTLPRVATVLSARNGRLSVVNETTFTAPLNQGSNNLLINVERFEIAYEFGDWLRVKAGRFHTAFGYYNDTFHTGFYYQLPVDRPGFVNYEDNGGLIPARGIGLHADGRIPVLTIGKIKWDAELINNRAQKPTDTTIAADGGQIPRAFNGRLRFEPGGVLEGLIVGGNFYTGHIKGSTQVVPLSDFNLGGSLGLPSSIRLNGQLQVDIPDYKETTWGVHLAYEENNLHVIAEYAHFDHQRTAGTCVDDAHVNNPNGLPRCTDTSEGGFVQVGYSFGDFTPFFLVDRISLAHGDDIAEVPAIPPGVVPQLPDGRPAIPAVPAANNFSDPYFAYSVISQIFGSNWRYSAGVRWQPIDGLALKATVARWVGDGGSSVTSVYGQAAVAF
jgi:hypothetical protein